MKKFPPVPDATAIDKGTGWVAVVTPYYPESHDPIAGIFVQEQALQLRRRGIDARVFHVKRVPGPWRQKARKRVLGGLRAGALTGQDGVPVYRCGYYAPAHPLFDRLWIESMARAVRRAVAGAGIGKPRAVLAQWLLPTAAACLRAAVAPHIVGIGRGMDLSRLADRSRYARRALAGVVGNIGFVAGNGLWAADALAQLGIPVPEDKFLVIRNARDLRLWNAVAPACKREGALQLISVSRLDLKTKRIDILLRAAARASRQSGRLEITLVGDGPDRAAIERIADELKEELTVRLPGNLPHRMIARLFADADVFVLASAREGCPNAVVEAMASSLPVIASRVGEIPYLIRSGEEGFVVDRNDEQAFAEAIVASARKRADLPGMGGKARLRVNQMFDSEKSLDTLITALKATRHEN